MYVGHDPAFPAYAKLPLTLERGGRGTDNAGLMITSDCWDASNNSS